MRRLPLYSLRKGVRNLWEWWPLVWGDRDWDHYFLTRIMEFKLRRMTRYFRERGHLVASDRHARQMAVCAELCRRLKEDDTFYMDQADRAFPAHSPAWSRAYGRHSKEDQAYLGRMLGKYLSHWWD